METHRTNRRRVLSVTSALGAAAASGCMDRVFSEFASETGGCWFEATSVDDPSMDGTVYDGDDRELTRPVDRLLRAAANPESDYPNVERFTEDGTDRFVYHPETEDEVEGTERLLDSSEDYTGGDGPDGVHFTNGDVTIAVVMACQA